MFDFFTERTILLSIVYIAQTLYRISHAVYPIPPTRSHGEWFMDFMKDQPGDDLDLKLQISDNDNFQKMADSWFSSCTIN